MGANSTCIPSKKEVDIFYYFPNYIAVCLTFYSIIFWYFIDTKFRSQQIILQAQTLSKFFNTLRAGRAHLDFCLQSYCLSV